MPPLFVTGTDTGVGKTTVSRALLGAFRRRGALVTPLKPVETGCATGPDGALVAADADALADAAGTPRGDACVLRFALPVAPEAAARAASTAIDPQALVAECRRRLGPRTLVEGAGGLLVPIAPGFTMADLAAALSARVLIVARTRLGTLSHTLLTVSECRRRGLLVSAVVLNRTLAEAGPEEPTNAELLASHGAVPVLGPLPHAPDAPLEALVELCERHLPVAQLLAELA